MDKTATLVFDLLSEHGNSTALSADDAFDRPVSRLALSHECVTQRSVVFLLGKKFCTGHSLLIVSLFLYLLAGTTSGITEILQEAGKITVTDATNAV